MKEPRTPSNESLFPHPPNPAIKFYKQQLDLDAIRANLYLTPEERINKLMELNRRAEELHRLEEAKQRLIAAIHNSAG